MLDSSDAHFQGMPTVGAWSDRWSLLLLHVEVSVWVGYLAHVRAFLLNAQSISPISVLAMGASRVVALLAPNCEIIESLTRHTKIVVAIF